MNWTYYTCGADGFLYDEEGFREIFDGASRTADQWEAYFEAEDIRGTIR